jgi:pyruvate/2-oxoglutarate dehydrogenase complex dihydrolipoamide dehydrogenase (E3) component
MAQEGHRTAVVERKYVGRSCPNIACLPSKNVIRSAKANWFARHGPEYGIRVRIDGLNGEQTIEGTDLLVATGRTPNTRGIGVEAAGIELDTRGYIKVNERLETTAPGVWAMGDCAGSPQFTHVAYDDFRVVRDNLNGGSRTTRDRLIPFCMFTDPELARIGLNEIEAKKRGIAYRLAKLPMAAVLRAVTLGETRGFVKMLVDTQSDRILGFTALGIEASEMMAAVQTAMLGGLSYIVLRDAIFTLHHHRRRFGPFAGERICKGPATGSLGPSGMFLAGMSRLERPSMC